MTARSAESGWQQIGWLLLALFLFSFPIRYVQQITTGHVVLFTGILRLGLFAAAVGFAVVVASGERSRQQIAVIALGYVLVSLLVYNILIVDFGLFYTAFGFNLFCVPPAIALLFLLNSRYFPIRGWAAEQRLLHILLVVAVPVAAFGIIQWVSGNSLLQTQFAGNAQDEYGAAGQATIHLTELASTQGLRANSIFDSAIDFGYFGILFALLCTGMAFKTRSRPGLACIYAALAAIFTLAILSTNTRNILLYYVCDLIGLALLLSGLGPRAVAALAVSFVAIFYGTVYGLISSAPGFFLGFFDAVSLFQRAQGVYATVDRFIWNADSPLHVLFGYGYMQSLDFAFLPTTVFDNTELDLYLYAGVAGVALYLCLLYVLFRRSYALWRQTGSVAWLAVTGFLVGTPLFSTMNIQLDQPYFLFVFGLLVGGAVIRERTASQASIAPKPQPATGRA